MSAAPSPHSDRSATRRARSRTPKYAWRTKHIQIHTPRYWNVSGRTTFNGLKTNAASGIESVKTIELAKSSPSFGFAPIGHCNKGVSRKNAQPR